MLTPSTRACARCTGCLQERTLVEARAEGAGRARGSNQELEKAYLRLTSLPSVADVRPPQVLRQALELVKQKWVQVRVRGGERFAAENKWVPERGSGGARFAAEE